MTQKCSEIVFNNANPEQFFLPTAMGVPDDGQATGTPLEVLAETAGRICYDSYGRGRTSNKYHQHIAEVGHLSVYEHCVFTVEFDQWFDSWFETLVNRPGVHIERSKDSKVRLTTNLRAVLEWRKHEDGTQSKASRYIQGELTRHAAELAPQIVALNRTGVNISRVVKPSTIDEVWVSVWLKGSRGFSHEMVRHGDSTAISQRSTRYVHEEIDNVCWHPEVVDLTNGMSVLNVNAATLDCALATAFEAYDDLIDSLIDLGCDKKTAYGAARGILPNALATQMIFSASLRQWNHIFAMRCSPYADGEIRAIMQDLKSKMFSDRLALAAGGDR